MSMSAQPASFTIRIANPLSREADRAGTHYEDSYARSLGYKRATVGGFVSGRVCLAATEAWGLAWLQSGEHYNRQRQPVYADDEVQVHFQSPREEGGFRKCDYQVVTSEGVAAIIGWAGLRGEHGTPPLTEFSFESRRSTPVRVMDGEKIIGTRLASEIISDAHRGGGASSAEAYRLGATPTQSRLWTLPAHVLHANPDLPARSLASWMLSGGSQHVDIDYDGSNIRAVTESAQRFYATATLDDRLEVHHRISDAFERKGSRYFQLEMLVVANGTTPIMSERVTRVIHLASRPPAETPA